MIYTVENLHHLQIEYPLAWENQRPFFFSLRSDLLSFHALRCIHSRYSLLNWVDFSKHLISGAEIYGQICVVIKCVIHCMLKNLLTLCSFVFSLALVRQLLRFITKLERNSAVFLSLRISVTLSARAKKLHRCNAYVTSRCFVVYSGGETASKLISPDSCHCCSSE